MSVKPLERLDAEASLRERISCLMDGADDAAALSALCADDRAREDWAIWHMAGDALRSSEVAALHSPRFASRVSQALAAEPAIVAPRALSASPSRAMRRLVLPGAAAAAAVAVMAFIAVPMLRGAGEVEGSGFEVARVQGASQPSGSMVQTVPVSSIARGLPAPGVQTVNFDAYISAHSQMSGTLGLSRTSPYLRQGTAVDADGRTGR
ncbi:MAG: sigma-E factor negative regulatory protein [Burkholderiaceae bacterium]|jgi:sigma-E factor negative regulatory protein RseA|nr:sigma-E factor negative regulatory protein [Burkholderiaceae bacterium]